MPNAFSPRQPTRQHRALLVIGVLLVFIGRRADSALHFALKRHDDPAVRRRGRLSAGQVRWSAARRSRPPPPRSWTTSCTSGTGWRPNDFFLWGPSIGRRQQRQPPARHHPGDARERARVQRSPDQDLVQRIRSQPGREPTRLLRNDETKFWLPSAESRYKEAVKALQQATQAGLAKTPPTSKPLNQRNIELIRLFQTLVGHARRRARRALQGRRVGRQQRQVWDTDDYFYHAQGVAHDDSPPGQGGASASMPSSSSTGRASRSRSTK